MSAFKVLIIALIIGSCLPFLTGGHSLMDITSESNSDQISFRIDEPLNSLDELIFTDDDFTSRLNSTTFSPGDYVHISTLASTNSWINTSVSWDLMSPMSQLVLSIETGIFVDVNKTDQTIGSISEEGLNQNLTSSYVIHANRTDALEGYVNVTVELPSYPAVLGTWMLRFYVNDNSTEENIATVRCYFTLKDEVVFTPIDTFLLDPTVPNLWTNDTKIDTGVFSPGDNITLL